MLLTITKVKILKSALLDEEVRTQKQGDKQVVVANKSRVVANKSREKEDEKNVKNEVGPL
jgi:hypothetical protein